MADKKNTNTDIQLSTAKTDEVIDLLKEEAKKLRKITDAPWKTPGKITGFETGIREETLIENLLRMGSVAKQRERAYNEYAEDIQGLTSYPAYEDQGGNSQGFDEDIAQRIAIIEQKDRMDKLEKLMKEGSKYLSEVDQKNSWLNEVSKVLGK